MKPVRGQVGLIINAAFYGFAGFGVLEYKCKQDPVFLSFIAIIRGVRDSMGNKKQ
jgi:hypothetical protein